MVPVIALAPNFTVLTSALGHAVSYSTIGPQGEQKWDGFEVNESGLKVLAHLQACDDPYSFIDSFRQKNNLPPEARSWISDFLKDLLQRGALHIKDIDGLQQQDSPSFHRARLIEIRETANATAPQSAIIEITNTCNEACEHCYLSSGPKRKDYITFERFTELCEEMARSHVYRVQLTGGEVFMHPRAEEMISHALEKFPEVAIFTNGTILTERVLQLLERNKDRLVISVSLDSVDPEIHNKLRNHRNAHQKTSRNIKRMTQAGLFVRVTSVLFDDNMWELDSLAQQASDLGARLFVFNFVESFGRGKDMVAQQKEGANAEYARYIARTVEKYRDVIPIIEEEMTGEAAARDNCGAGSNSVVISASGDIRPCNLFPEEVSFGNVLEREWDDLFQDPLLRAIHDLPSPGIEAGCDPRCPSRTYCQGCILHGITHNAWENHPHYCTWVRENNVEPIIEKFVGLR